MNKLAKIIDNQIVYAQSSQSIILNNRRIFNPTQEQYRQAGFNELPNIEHNSNQNVIYYIEDNQIKGRAENIVRVVRYSKLKLIENIQKAGVEWEQVENWLSQNNLLAKWNAAQQLSNDYEGFEDIVNIAKQTFSNVNIDSILLESQIN